MHRHATSPTVAGRLIPLAAGTALVLIATGVGLARYRKGLAPQGPAITTAVAHPTVGAAPPEDSASFAPGLAIRQDHARTAARLGPILMAAALVLSGLGVGFVGVALASQRHAHAPAATSPEPQIVVGRDIEGWPARSLPAAPTPPAERPLPRRTPATSTVGLPRSRPVSLHISAIGVRSVVRALGQADDGTLETPQPGPRYNDAAWYRHSPTPGSLGPSILLGHVDSAAGGPSVFFRLGELTAGDRVTVTRADGSVAVFRVDVVRRYAKDAFPTDVVYGNIDHAGLRIVTCGGAFDNASGHYRDNVVVFASLNGSPRH